MSPPATPLLAALHDRPDPDAPVLVGFSGGLDSSVLLHLLAHAGMPVRAIHVHHGLQPEADAWAIHCRQACADIGVDLDIARVEVARNSGLGIEAAARDARHAAFANAMHDGEVLVLGHHRDDQAETFLLRALRGAGPDGLAAMRRWRRFAQGHLWRPLLDTPRERLLQYALQQDLRWIEDPSNHQTQLDRVFVRERLLPMLRERWPQATATLARNARLQGDASTLLLQHDAVDLASVRSVDPAIVDMARLLQLPRARRARVLRAWIRDLQLPALPAEGLRQIEAMLHARPDAEPAFAYAGTCIRRWRDVLHAGKLRAPLPASWSTDWDGADALTLPGGGQLRLLGADQLPAPARVHARQGGERILLPGRGHRHTLKHALQQLGLPPWEREQLPLVTGADGSLLAAGDVLYAAAFDAWLRSQRARLHWTPPA